MHQINQEANILRTIKRLKDVCRPVIEKIRQSEFVLKQKSDEYEHLS